MALVNTINKALAALYALCFDLDSHNGCITVNRPAGVILPYAAHKTFRVFTINEESKSFPEYMRGRRVVAVFNGTDNEDEGSFWNFGWVVKGKVVVWKSAREKCPDVVAYAKMLNDSDKYKKAGFEYLYEGACVKCNGKLTNPISIWAGKGQKCAGGYKAWKYLAAMAQAQMSDQGHTIESFTAAVEAAKAA